MTLEDFADDFFLSGEYVTYGQEQEEKEEKKGEDSLQTNTSTQSFGSPDGSDFFSAILQEVELEDAGGKECDWAQFVQDPLSMQAPDQQSDDWFSPLEAPDFKLCFMGQDELQHFEPLEEEWSPRPCSDSLDSSHSCSSSRFGTDPDRSAEMDSVDSAMRNSLIADMLGSSSSNRSRSRRSSSRESRKHGKRRRRASSGRSEQESGLSSSYGTDLDLSTEIDTLTLRNALIADMLSSSSSSSRNKSSTSRRRDRKYKIRRRAKRHSFQIQTSTKQVTQAEEAVTMAL